MPPPDADIVEDYIVVSFFIVKVSARFYYCIYYYCYYCCSLSTPIILVKPRSKASNKPYGILANHEPSPPLYTAVPDDDNYSDMDCSSFITYGFTYGDGLLNYLI